MDDPLDLWVMVTMIDLICDTKVWYYQVFDIYGISKFDQTFFVRYVSQTLGITYTCINLLLFYLATPFLLYA